MIVTINKDDLNINIEFKDRIMKVNANGKEYKSHGCIAINSKIYINEIIESIKIDLERLNETRIS